MLLTYDSGTILSSKLQLYLWEDAVLLGYLPVRMYSATGMHASVGMALE